MDNTGSDDKDQLIQQFTNVTGVDASRARFYLESSAWQINVALAAFYDNEDDSDGFQPEIIEASDAGHDDEQAMESQPVAEASQSIPTEDPDKRKHSTRSRFATLQSLHDQRQQSNTDENADKGQAFYAGGSESSGQQVLGPPTRKAHDVIKDMFKSATEHGATAVEDMSSNKASNSFLGTGFRLGASENDSQVIPAERRSRSGPEQRNVVLKLWEDGFSVDDGPLRQYDQPSNAEFLKSIRRGEIPQELVRQAGQSEVNLDMEDHRNEQYVPVKYKMKAFTGTGHLLGSPVVPIADTSPAAEPAKPDAFSVDQAQPTTNIQLRLADGLRTTLQMNHQHTVEDIRRHIVTQHPQYENANFVLMTTFPSKELTNGSACLAEAGLLNAVIVQRLK